MATHKTNKKRNGRQKLKAKYAKVREDAQLAGIIPTTPEGALHGNEVVNPSTQSEQSIPAIDRAAVVKGWQVPEHVKAKVIERLAEPFFEEPVTVEGPDGEMVQIPPDRYLLKENAKVLVQASKFQHEVDEPEAAGKAKGSIEINNQVNVFNWDELFKAMTSKPSIEERMRAALEHQLAAAEQASEEPANEHG